MNFPQRLPPFNRETIPVGLQHRAKQISQTAVQQQLPVRYMGSGPLFSGSRRYEGQTNDWVFVPADEDPLFNDGRRFPIPQQILNQLERIADSGIEFDNLYVAHELPRGALPTDGRLTYNLLAPPPSPRSQEIARRLGNIVETAWRVVWRSGSAAYQAISRQTAVVNQSIELDPIIMGAIVTPGQVCRAGQIACWFYLAHWAY